MAIGGKWSPRSATPEGIGFDESTCESYTRTGGDGTLTCGHQSNRHASTKKILGVYDAMCEAHRHGTVNAWRPENDIIVYESFRQSIA